MGNKKIIERIYYCLELKLTSPLIVGNGISKETDCDIMLDANGNPFIPGTSIAGAIRDYMDFKNNSKCIMGVMKCENEHGTMSSVYFSDVVFDSGNTTIDMRDGVALKTDKTVDNKYDYQILNAGAIGYLFMNFIIREGDDKEKYLQFISTFVERTNLGEIRFGAKKNRGFGRISVESVKSKTFNSENVDDFIEQKGEMHDVKLYNEEFTPKSSIDVTEIFDIFEMQLELKGGISIRKYSAEPNSPDFDTIKAIDADEKLKPIIPGTSWSGAIRSATYKILKELGVNKPNEIIGEWFGQIEKKTAKQSKIVFGESIIDGGKDKIMTRNAINRFDASTKDGALYTEGTHFGGTTTLRIMVKKGNKHILGALGLALKDLNNGLLSVGGETSIGRGLFSVVNEHDIDDRLATKENLIELACYLRDK